MPIMAGCIPGILFTTRPRTLSIGTPQNLPLRIPRKLRYSLIPYGWTRGLTQPICPPRIFIMARVWLPSIKGLLDDSPSPGMELRRLVAHQRPLTLLNNYLARSTLDLLII